MKIKHLLISFFIVLIVLFSGCIGNPLKEESTFLSTSQSLDARFLQNAPPKNIFIGDRFNIWLEIENTGEKKIDAGEVRVDLSNANLFRHYYSYNLEGHDEYGRKNRYADFLWWMKELTKYTSHKEPFNYNDKFEWASALGCKDKRGILCSESTDNTYKNECIRNCVYEFQEDLKKEFSHVPDYNEFNSTNKQYIEFNPTRYNINYLRPARKDPESGNRIPGANELIMYDDLTYVAGESITEERPIDISAKICYPYQTEGISTICVTKSSIESEICDPIAERKAETSSGPIHLKAVEQKTNGYSSEGEAQVVTRIDFVFEKADYKKDIFSNTHCLERVSPYNKDSFNVTFLKIGSKEYDPEQVCGTSKIELRADGTGRISCKFPINGVHNDYLERVVIRTNYVVIMETSTDTHVMPTL